MAGTDDHGQASSHSAQTEEHSRGRGRQAVPSSARSTGSGKPTSTNQGMSALTTLLMRNDGWLRACPDGDSTLVYLKWKFTGGRWANHYVMVLVYYWQLDYGFSLLLDKVHAVEEGAKRPSKDTYYRHD